MTNRTAKQRRLLPEDLFGSESDEEDEDKEEFNDFLESDDDRPQIRAQRRPNKERDHQGGHEKLMRDYFERDATFNDADFERRFRMKRGLLIKIPADVEAICPYFVQKPVCPTFSFFYFILSYF
jgi:hypothetical protein